MDLEAINRFFARHFWEAERDDGHGPERAGDLRPEIYRAKGVVHVDMLHI